ncbi:MAG: hypothetical protein K9I94_03090 [Bacteroidales bacterium]|nr:hypothetical protein [Bacteroidales bacterium]
MKLLEITGDDVAKLNDKQLRELLGLLCEADYRVASLTTRGIRWGGHQDAKDGGLDVVVQSNFDPPDSSFIPSKSTGFQIKISDMPRHKILKEMRPNNQLRPEIKQLIKEKGAYVIVSSKSSNTNTALNNRLGAMEEAIQNENDWNKLTLDFYGCDRIASWLRFHPSLVFWLRNKINKSLDGWLPYDNWAQCPGGANENYLLDDQFRLMEMSSKDFSSYSVRDGLYNLCLILSIPGNSIRLTGLSGVGKTRLVQALFDNNLVNNALNSSQAIYTDISFNPYPTPTNLANQLINEKSRAILIVDNCKPELHNQLTKICTKENSVLSLITVEYDIRDNDLPEDTQCFKLEPASVEVIKNILRIQNKQIGQINEQIIAKHSGGNAKIALALAKTLQIGETLSDIKDNLLFERLFYQGNEKSESLLQSAEACSLVYSFNGEETISEKSELKVLGELIDKSCPNLYTDVAVLIQRDLIQTRGKWRAILPEAIANWLAKRALNKIPKDRIYSTFLKTGSERLLKSFSRRLGNLHDSKIAVDIVSDWLSIGGIIGKSITNLSRLEIDVLRNIAPVCPQKTLEIIEHAANGIGGSQFTSRINPYHREFTTILRHIAYEEKYFERGVSLICRFAITEKIGETYNSIRDLLKSLFYIYLSGSHAKPSIRAKFIEKLIFSEDNEKTTIGLSLLEASLEYGHFSSLYRHEFGARPRNFGYEPRSLSEIQEWFGPFITLCTTVAILDQFPSRKARKMLADKLPNLWTRAGLYDIIERSMNQILKKHSWHEGWISIQYMIERDIDQHEKDVKERLHRLEEKLRPKTLLEKSRIFTLADARYRISLKAELGDSADSIEDIDKPYETTRRLGFKVAKNLEVLQSLLPDLIINNEKISNHHRLYVFGQGLAAGAKEPSKIWKNICKALEGVSREKWNLFLFTGFLSAFHKKNKRTYDKILDSIVEDKLLREQYPLFEASAPIDKAGVNRLFKALKVGKADVRTYLHIGSGAHETISSDDLAKILHEILKSENGSNITLGILSSRFYNLDKNPSRINNKLIKVAQKALENFRFKEIRGSRLIDDHDLHYVAKYALVGKEGANIASKLCRNFMIKFKEEYSFKDDYPELLSAIARQQPISFLNEVLSHEQIGDYPFNILTRKSENISKPIDSIPDFVIIEWCEQNPHRRYVLISSLIQTYYRNKDNNSFTWKSIVLKIISQAPNLGEVFNELADSISPWVCHGSRAAALEKRLVLFESLYNHNNTKVRNWALSEHEKMQEKITKLREMEKMREIEMKERNESFE